MKKEEILNMQKKNKVLCIWAVVLTIMMTTASASVITVTNEDFGEGVKVVKLEAAPISESMKITRTLEIMKNNVMSANIPITSAPEDEFNPTIGISLDETLGLAYTFKQDFFTSEVRWFYSIDNGNTWDGGVVWTIEGIQQGPSIDYAGTDKYFVGSVQDPVNGDGAIQHCFYMPDITDSETWEGHSWAWADSYPYRDRGIPDIAGYDGLGIDWWKHLTICVGTRDVRENMPILNYFNYEDETSGWSSYHDSFQGCENSAVDIDQTNGYFYAVCDPYNETRGDWDIALISGDCHPDAEGGLTYNEYQVLGDTKNSKSPDVGAHGSTVMIVAQQDELILGKEDIVCYYSSDHGQSWDMSIVAGNSADSETNPSIVVYGASATCTFAIDGDLYASHTVDGGVTWTEAERINNQESSFVNERHNSAITNGGSVVWTDNRDGNSDIYFDNIGFPPSAVIDISGISGGFGITATLSNIGGADAVDLQWSIDLDGGLILIGKHKEGTIPILAAGNSETVRTGFVFGLGKTTITITAGGVTQTAEGTVLGPFVTGI